MRIKAFAGISGNSTTKVDRESESCRSAQINCCYPEIALLGSERMLKEGTRDVKQKKMNGRSGFP